jgi:DNA topoisomerase IB
VRSDDVNGYLREVAEGDFTAKDFRTWHATVLMAVARAVCKASYVDPRIVDLYAGGTTIAPILDELGAEVDGGQLATQGRIEQAVLDLLRDRG